MTKQSVEVSSRGELVILRIGNTDLAMHYEHAFDVSRWMRIEARAIKDMTGRGRTVRSLGILEDADARTKPLPLVSGVPIHSNRKLIRSHREDVYSEGRMVNVKIGNSTITLHFENALKVAQWLRVRAKEARNRAGDARHWSTLATEDDG